MVGNPEAPEAATPEMMRGKDVHDGQDQEQHHPCEACKKKHRMNARARSRHLGAAEFPFHSRVLKMSEKIPSILLCPPFPTQCLMMMTENFHFNRLMLHYMVPQTPVSLFVLHLCRFPQLHNRGQVTLESKVHLRILASKVGWSYWRCQRNVCCAA